MKSYQDEVEYVFESTIQDRRRSLSRGNISEEETLIFIDLLDYFEAKCREGLTMEDYAEILPQMIGYFRKLNENNIQTIVSKRIFSLLLERFVAEKENLLSKPVCGLVEIMSIYSTFSNGEFLDNFDFLQTLVNVVTYGNGAVKENAEIAISNSLYFSKTVLTLDGKDVYDICSFDVPAIFLSMSNLESKSLFYAFYCMYSKEDNTAILLNLAMHGVNLFLSNIVQAFSVINYLLIGLQHLIIRAQRKAPILEKLSELFSVDAMEKISSCLLSSEVTRQAGFLLYCLFKNGIRSNEIREDVISKVEFLISNEDPNIVCSGLYLISTILNVKFEHDLVPGGPVESALNSLQRLIESEDLSIRIRMDGVSVFQQFLKKDTSIMCYINNELADALVELLINTPSDENMICLLDTLTILCEEGHGVAEYLACDECNFKEDLMEFLEETLEDSVCCEEAWNKADNFKSLIESSEKNKVVIRSYDDWY